MNFGAPELAIVLLIVLVLFGGKKLPEIARGLGQAQREFRAGMHDEESPSEPGAATERSATDEPRESGPAAS